MPVQVPQLERFAPQAPERTVLQNDAVVNEVRPQQQINQAIEGVADTSIKIYQKAEDDYIDTKKTEISNSYDRWYKKRVYGDSESGTPGLIHIEGDATEAYNQFDKEANQKREELLNSGDYSDYAKRKITASLTERDQSLYESRLVAYGNQHAQYEQKVTKEAVDIETNNAVESTQYIKKDDPNALAPLDATLNKIYRLHVDQGSKVGLANVKEEPQADGTTKKVTDISPILHGQIDEDVAKAVYNSVNNLLAADKVDEAKIVLGKYETVLNPDQRAKVENELHKAGNKSEAYELVADVQKVSKKGNYVPMSTGEIIRKINLSGKSEEVKDTAIQIINDKETRIQAMKSRDGVENYSDLYDYVKKRQESKEPFDTLTEYRSDPFVSSKLQFLNPTQKKALDGLVDKSIRPKKSDPKALQSIQETARLTKFYGMDSKTFNTSAADLNDRDYHIYEAEWRRQNVESDAAERSKISGVTERVTNIYKNTAKYQNSLVDGQPSQEVRDELSAMINQVYENGNSFMKGASQEELNRYVNKQMTDNLKRIEGEQDTRSWWDKLRGVKKPAPPKFDPFSSRKREAAPSAEQPVDKPKENAVNGYESLSPEKQKAARMGYKAETGLVADDPAKIDAWLQKKAKK